MSINLESFLSQNMGVAKRSAIREILKLTQKPDIISFAGGLPAEASFPIEDIKQCIIEVLDEMPAKALQYGTTEGYDILREEIVKHYKKQGVNIGINNLMITTASQQGLDITGKLFINPGDKLIAGLPSYLGGLSAFKSYGADIVGIKFDEFGMRSDLLENKLKEITSKNEKIKFIYIIPDFQNPAGITYPEVRRKEILELANKYNLLVIEDSPYRELRFEGEAQKMIYQLDNNKDNRVIVLGTFSKILAPGFRLGWVLADEAIIDKYVVAKQATDLCTPAILQMAVAKYMQKGLLDKNLMKTIEMYRIKRDLMLDCLKKYMPEQVTWTEPQGGLFLFVYLPQHIDSLEVLNKAIENKVAFVTGQSFHCDGSGKNTLRINFSFPTHEQIQKGVERLANTIKLFL